MKNIIIITFLVFVLSLSAESISLYPVSDNYTDVEHVGSDNVLTELWTANFVPAGNYQRINLDFDISPYLQSGFESGQLNLTRFFSCPSSGTTMIKIYPITQVWDETSCDIHQHLNYEESIYTQYHLTGTPGSSIKHFSLDVTDILDEVINSNIEFHGFMIKANDNQKFSKFYSKEYSNVDYRPSLDIVYSGVSNDINQIFPSELKLTVFPNPFNPTTSIEFSNPHSLASQISIYNIKGRLVKRTSLAGSKGSKSSFTWNARNDNNEEVASGLYFCRVQVGKQEEIKKIILQK